jgi:hypothetical protein
MQHLAYANLYFSHSPAVCLSYLTYDSLSLSALVTYLSSCYHSDLLCNLPDATNISANVYIMYHYNPEINFDPPKKM